MRCREKQLSPGSACFGLHALCSVTAQHVVLGQARMGPREKTKPQPLRNNHTAFQGSLDSMFTPKGTRTSSEHRSLISLRPLKQYLYISVVWGQCKSACSKLEFSRALRDNLCQPHLPTSCTDKTVQGVGPSSLKNSPTASVLTNAL